MGWLIVVGVASLFALFVIGCALAQSQFEAEINAICGFKLTVRSKSFLPGKKYYERSVFVGTVAEAQEYLNSFAWSHVLSATLVNTGSDARWEANDVGVLVRIPPKVTVSV